MKVLLAVILLLLFPACIHAEHRGQIKARQGDFITWGNQHLQCVAPDRETLRCSEIGKYPNLVVYFTRTALVVFRLDWGGAQAVTLLETRR